MADDPQSVSQDDPGVEIRAKPVFKLVGKYILGNVLGNGAFHLMACLATISL